MSLLSNEITSLISNIGFCGSNKFECVPASGTATSSLLWILISPLLTQGVITNISVIQIPSWFFALTPFETIFIGFTLLWICALQYVGVLPINLNNLFYGSPSGRRKRRWILRSEETQETLSKESQIQNILQTLLMTLRRLDKDECIPRTLCELEKEIKLGYSLPKGIQLILNVLKFIPQDETPWEFYKSAVNLRNYTRIHKNSTICEVQYPACRATQEDIFNYISQLNFDEII